MLGSSREFCCLGSYMTSNGLDQENLFREQHAFQEIAMTLTLN